MIKKYNTKKTQKQILEEIFEKKTYDKYYDDWIRNFALNLNHIWNGKSIRDCFSYNKKFKSKTALVIGRGPSLIKNKHLELLSDSGYNGTIICADSALKSCLNSGVTPEKFKRFYVVSIDTNDYVNKFYQGSIVKRFGKKIKCLLSTTVHPSTYKDATKSGMDVFWFHTLFDYNKGKSSFNYISGIISKSKNHVRGFPAIQTGGNVGTSSWILAWSILKLSPVGLIGIDHGYTNDMSWVAISEQHKIPKGINQNSKAYKKAYPTVYNPDFRTYCKQDPLFVYYSNALKEFIPKAPDWVKTINATEGGAIFGKGIKCMKFGEFLKKFG